jgi:hypothetical protein
VRAHLFALARPTPAKHQVTRAQRVRPGLRQVPDALTGVPAIVLGHRLDILEANALARALFTGLEGLPRDEWNMARLLVHHHAYGTERFHHPVAGDLSLRYEAFTPNGEPDQVLCPYVAEPGSPSEQALRRLAVVRAG